MFACGCFVSGFSTLKMEKWVMTVWEWIEQTEAEI